MLVYSISMKSKVSGDMVWHRLSENSISLMVPKRIPEVRAEHQSVLAVIKRDLRIVARIIVILARLAIIVVLIVALIIIIVALMIGYITYGMQDCGEKTLKQEQCPG